jgi:Fe2+ transport system protein B
MTFVMPCINALIVLIKERGVATAFSVLTLTVVWALLTGALVNWTCLGLGLTFT